MRSATIILMVILIAAAIVGCTSKAKEIQRVMDSPIAVDSQFEEGANFGQFASWNWIPMTQMPGQDPLTGDMDITKEIKEAFDGGMYTRGYRKVDSSYDLIANFHLASETVDKAYINEYYGGKYPEYKADMTGSKDDNKTWDEGTLIFFLFDPRNGQLVFQSSAQAEVTEGASIEQRHTRINKVVTMMLAELPKRSATP